MGVAQTAQRGTHSEGAAQGPSTRWVGVGHVREGDSRAAGREAAAEPLAGRAAWFMHGDADSVLRSTSSACGDAVAALGGAPPLGLIAFDCIGRRGVLGDERLAEEVASIGDCAGGAPFAGLYTYGEIARVTGVNALHSQTFVAMAIG